MKIEKVNDNQIRCTLTREDLASRHLKLSELAYGSEKAKRLFRDMMQQANFEFGFEAEDIPLMIEAIPLNAECIVLIITKVEDPEELDTRFSRFSPSDEEDTEDEFDTEEDMVRQTADLFRQIQDAGTLPREASLEKPVLPRVFRFRSLQSVMEAAPFTKDLYDGENTLYKDEATGYFLLVLSPGNCPLENYDRVCNLLSEYGSLQKMSQLGKSFLEEHYEPLLEGDALQSLNRIG